MAFRSPPPYREPFSYENEYFKCAKEYKCKTTKAGPGMKAYHACAKVNNCIRRGKPPANNGKRYDKTKSAAENKGTWGGPRISKRPKKLTNQQRKLMRDDVGGAGLHKKGPIGNPWISHVKSYQHQHRCTYQEALRRSKKSYKRGGSYYPP